MVQTPSEIEAAVHKKFDQETAPSYQEVKDFLNTEYPRMDVAIPDETFPRMEVGVLIIALAGFIINAWNVYRNEQERKVAEHRASGSDGPCPVCDDIWKNSAGKWTCKHKFTW